MQTRNIAESNDYRMFYRNQPSIDVARIRFSDKMQAAIPAEIRREFLSGACEAYNRMPTQDDALDILSNAKNTIKDAARARRQESNEAAIAILRDATA